MPTLSIEQSLQLVDKLLHCPCMATFASRESIVLRLPTRIGHKMALSGSMETKMQVLGIVTTCLNFEDGLAELLRLVKYFDGRSASFSELVAYLAGQGFSELVEQIAAFPIGSGVLTGELTKAERLRKLFSDHTHFIKDRLASFVGRANELAEIEQRIEEKLATGGYVTITGQAGQGKSSVIARLVQDRLDKLWEQGGAEQADLLAYHFIPFSPGPDHQVGLLRNLMVRLIVKYDLPDIYVAGEQKATLRDMFPNVLREVVAKGGQEVIFIDGLDQLEHESSGKRDLSFLPTNPPLGIVFVLGTRPDDTLKPLELLKPKHEYKLPELSRADFELVLEHRGVKLSRDLVSRFYEAMQKNALYLDLVAQELRLAENCTPEEVIKKLADNPENLFELAIDRFKRDWREWSEVIKPILGALITAQEPLPLFSIKQLLKLEGDKLTDAIQKLGGLLSQGSQGRYYIYHLKLIEYLLPNPNEIGKLATCDQEFVECMHAKFVDWCENGNRGMETIWQNKFDDDAEIFRRTYARQHYITHLYHAHYWTKLFGVLDSSDYGKHKVRDYDFSTHGYAQDLDLGRAVCSQVGLSLEEGLNLLPNLWRYTLLRVSLASRVDSYPVEIFEQLYLTDRKKECMGKIELLTEPERKVEVLARIGSLILETLNSKSRQVETEAALIYLHALTVAEKFAGNRVISILVQHPEIVGNSERLKKLISIADSVVSDKYNSEFSIVYGRNSVLRKIVKTQLQAGLFDQALITADSIADESSKLELLEEIARAQAQAGLLDHALTTFGQALAIVSSISDMNSKEWLLEGIVKAQAQAGLFDQALITADSIADESSKLELLEEIARAQAQAGLFDQALATANSILNPHNKTELLGEIARAQAQAGLFDHALATFGQALAIVSSISDMNSKEWLLEGIVKAQAQAGLFDQALATVDSLADKRRKTEILAVIAKAQVQARLFDQALATANSIPNYRKTEILAGIAKVQAQVGLFDQALATANSILDLYSKIMILAEIAKVQAQAGLFDQALATFRLAVAATNPISSESIKDKILTEIARTQAQARLFKQALATIHLIDASTIPTELLEEIAKVQTQARLFKQALAVASSLSDGQSKAEIVGGIAQAQAQAGFLNQALATANFIPKYNKAEILEGIAKAQVQAGFLNQALATTNYINDGQSKAEVLGRIAKAQAQAGFLNQALATANSISDELKRVWVLEELTETQTQAGLYYQALVTVDFIADKRRKIDILERIAKAQMQAGLFGQALVTADSIADKSRKFDTLAGIAKVQAQVGLFDQALATANSIPNTIKRDKTRTLVLGEIAKAQAQAGLLNESLTTFGLAVAIANSIYNVMNSKEWLLEGIAKAQAQAGLFDQALITADSIADKSNNARLWALGEIAKAQAQAGLFDQALATANSLADKSNNARIWVLGEIAKAQARADLPYQSLTAFEQILTIAYSISDMDSKGWLLEVIARAQAQAGLFDQALATANSIQDERKRLWILREMARTQVQAGLFGQALVTADSIADKSRKFDILEDVAKAQAQAGLFDQALVTANSIADKRRKIDILEDVAKAQAQAALLNQALATANIIVEDSYKSKVMQSICEVLIENSKNNEALWLVHFVWRNVATREQALANLKVVLPLLKFRPDFGLIFFEAFEWVDDFLSHC